MFVGRATRAVEFASESEKEYVAGLRLGVETNTQDTTGTVLAERPVSVSQAELEQVLGQFRGEIRQIPPMYSAIKVGGKKLYELARKGQEVERQPRAVTIHSLTLEEQTGPADYTLRVRCSKGTYVRTLCHDIGRALGCGGCMSGLRRTMAAGFKLEDALPLEQVLQAEGPASLLLGVDAYFADRPVLILKASGRKKGAQRHEPVPAGDTGRGVPGLWGGGDLPSPEPDGAGKADHHQELLPGVSARKSAERKKKETYQIVNKNRRVIALGFLTESHNGHGALLRRVVDKARELDAVAAAFTL